MGTRKSYVWKGSDMFGWSSSELRVKESGDEMEWEEAEVWELWNDDNNDKSSRSVEEPEAKKLKTCRSGVGVGSASGISVPVNVPDWAKILKGEYKKREVYDDDDDEYEHDGVMVPPHVFLARIRGPSASVQEGRGRTLKGRDLRRVRNAVWKIIGFED